MSFSFLFLIAVLAAVFILIRSSSKRRSRIKQALAEKIPAAWKDILVKKVRFYMNLDEKDRILFEKRIQLFIAYKKIEGIDTGIDEEIKIMVASSAVIPTFAFPDYNYPHVTTVLIYPNNFDERFQTQRYGGHKEFISGMVGNRFMEGTVVLSKPDLMAAFDGTTHKGNVGIHEFVHLLDKEDGAIDGIPEALMDHKYIGPWLHEIKKEVKKIEEGKSDIDPYALKSNAEFLAVVSEYFFDNPEKFKRKHPELYGYLSVMFKTREGSV